MYDENIRIRCNQEVLEYSEDNGETWNYLTGCTESLWTIAEEIVGALNINISIEEF